MWPLFREGEIVLVCDQSPSILLRAGDCGVYEVGGEALLHRVVKVEQNGAWFADDAGRILPHFVEWRAVLGRVVSGKLLSKGLAGLIYSRGRSYLAPLFNKLLRRV